MIAKDTRENILAALQSAAPYVSSGYVLLSAPDDYLAALAAELVPYPVTFDVFDDAHLPGGLACTTKRTECVKRMAALGHTWALLLDSDDRFLPGGKLPDLEPGNGVDAYEIAAVLGTWRHHKAQLLRLGTFEWTWRGNVHEALERPAFAGFKNWDGLAYNATARTRPREHYLQFARILGDDLKANPANARAAFYRAYGLRDAGCYREAFDAFAARSHMSHGWDEETWWSVMWTAKLAPFVGEDCVPLYLRAHEMMPHRAEALAGLENHYRSTGRHNLAATFGQLAASKPYPVNARLFVDCGAYSDESRAAAGIA